MNIVTSSNRFIRRRNIIHFMLILTLGGTCIISLCYIYFHKEMQSIMEQYQRNNGIHSKNNKNNNEENVRQYEFNHINPHEQNWCPKAICFNSPLCQPCYKRYLFIIATGRSGSTTLLKMFNTLPNVRLSGENYNILFQFSWDVLQSIMGGDDDNDHVVRNNFVNHETMKEGYFMHDTIEDGPFMHNAIPIGSFACVFQHLLKTLNPPHITTPPATTTTTNYIDNNNHKSIIDNNDMFLQEENKEDDEDKTILGIKEIRLQDQDLIKWTPTEAAQFLQENFPCSRYIINISSAYIKQSMTMKKHLRNKVGELNRTQIQEKIKSENTFLIKLSEILGSDQARLLDLVEWQDDVMVLNDVVRWLGFEGCAFDKVAHENNNGFQHDNNNTTTTLGDNCIYPFL